MKKPSTGPLYVLSFIKWQQNLCFLHTDYYLARAEISPGFVIARPAWETAPDRERWITKTEAIEIDPAELNDDTRRKLSGYELMAVQ